MNPDGMLLETDMPCQYLQYCTKTDILLETDIKAVMDVGTGGMFFYTMSLVLEMHIEKHLRVYIVRSLQANINPNLKVISQFHAKAQIIVSFYFREEEENLQKEEEDQEFSEWKSVRNVSILFTLEPQSVYFLFLLKFYFLLLCREKREQCLNQRNQRRRFKMLVTEARSLSIIFCSINMQVMLILKLNGPTKEKNQVSHMILHCLECI